ncbi:MAG: hypothetical protein P4N59_14340 [Negativicutes bacterium]|nr:hypothetical protein [Negativicutes bacterium]
MSDQFNVASIKTAVQNCCRSEMECTSCHGKECLVGFAKIVADYAGVKKTLSIPNGLKMVPAADYKIYEIDQVAVALAVINHECKNCMDSHDDNCVINIVRSSLEVAMFGEHLKFAGNPLMYIMSLSEINPELGGKVMQEYRLLKSS